MSRFGFVGPTYQSQSPFANADLTMNWYVENDESGDAKGARFLYPTPGLKVFSEPQPGVPINALTTINGRLFAVTNQKLYEVFANGSSNLIGSLIINPGNKVFIANGQTFLFIVTGTNAYSFNLGSSALTDVTGSLAHILPRACAYSDGYYIVLFGAAFSNTFQISALNDPTTWSGVNVAQPSVFPDNITAILVDHRELWIFGLKATQVYYDSGATFPFVPIPGAFIEQGSSALSSPVRADNSVFWLGGDERGQAIAWRAQGYTPI